MERLYELVKEILNESSLELAKQRLYGINGLDINSSEYYENIVSHFVKKKDLILSKVDKDINYDLDKDIQDIWDIIFISQYIFKQWNQEQEELRKELHRLKSIKPSTNEIRNQIAELNKNVTLINTYFQKIGKESEISKVKIHGLNTNSQINIEKEIVELKKAILIFQKIRDSFEHRNSNLKLGKLIEIDNKKNFFKVVIPSDYIDGFNRGRIIAKEEDKEIRETTDSIAYPILRELQFDPKQLNSFFYNVSPNVMTKLIAYCDNDIHKLYKLPVEIFGKEEYVIDVIFNYVKKGMFSLEQLSLLPSPAFCSLTDKIENFDCELLDYFFNKKLDTKYITKMTQSDWLNSHEIINFIEYIINNNLDIEKVFCSNNRYSILRNKEQFKKTYEYLKSSDIDENIVYEINSFSNSDEIINVINYAKENNIELEKIFEILKNSKVYQVDLKRLAIVSQSLKKNNMSMDLLPSLYIKTDAILEDENIVRFLTDIKNLDIAMEDLLKIHINGFFNHDVLIELLKNREVLNISLKEIIEFPDVMFRNYDSTKYFLQFIKGANIGIEEALKLPLPEMWDNLEESLDFYEKIRTKYGDIIVSILPSDIFFYPQSFEKLTDYFEKNNINISDICKYVENDKKNEEQRFATAMWMSSFVREDGVIKIFEAAKKYDISLDALMKLPNWVSHNNRIESIIRLFENAKNNNIDVTMIADEMYRNYISSPQIIDYFTKKEINIDMSKLPVKLMNCKLNFDNIEILLNRVGMNYERLDEFPNEFFSCETELLNEMLTNYNVNICKSIFGIDNPKIVASLIYVNSVFSNIDRTINFENINIEPMQFIHNSYNDSIQFIKRNTGIGFGQEEYLKQFVVDDKTNEKRDFTNMKNYIVNKLRNSVAHFRFKALKEQDNSVVEDKIYLYDEYNDGTRNFNIVMNLNDLVNIARAVEIEIKQNASKSQTSSPLNR